MAIVLGLNAKLYVKAITGSPPTTMPPLPATTDEAKTCKDLTLTLEKNEVDITVRGGNGWRAIAPALKDGTYEFQLQWDTSDPIFGLIQQAFFTNSLLNILALDGLVVGDIGAQGLQACVMVASFTRNEALEEALTVDVKCRPAVPTVPPTWITTTTLAGAEAEEEAAA